MSDGLFITSFQLYSNMENNTSHLHRIIFEKRSNKVHTDITNLMQTWYRSSTILHHIFNNSSSHLQHIKLFLRIELANIYFNIHFILHLTIYETILHHNNWVTDISPIIHHILSQLFPNTSSQQLSDRYFTHHTSYTFTTLSKYFITTIEWQII